MLVFAVAFAPAGAPPHEQPLPPRLEQFLHQSIGLDPSQVRQVARGRVVVKVLDTPIKRDVAIFGIIGVSVTRDFYLDRVLHTTRWLDVPTRSHFGVFSDPAQPRDVRDVTIDPDDVRELKDCRPGNCKVKLPATEMRRIRQDIDWSSPDPGPEVDAYARKLMVAYVDSYRAHGDSAMVEYDDHGNVRSSDAFAALLVESPYVYRYVAAFHRYLLDYPRARLDGVKNVVYWADDSLPGLRPILSITHLSIYAPPDRAGTTVLAQKQIYADHYFEAGFDLTLVVDRPGSSGEPGVYLVAVRRYRFDKLPGGLFNIRGKVIGKLRDEMRRDLRDDRDASQKAFTAAGKRAGGSTPSHVGR